MRTAKPSRAATTGAPTAPPSSTRATLIPAPACNFGPLRDDSSRVHRHSLFRITFLAPSASARTSVAFRSPNTVLVLFPLISIINLARTKLF
ncbi:hypothetical protein RR46_03953 [Papilio xuthus]|uniref:Uncharacterized protein n=1 Tax=Papilio xuthus TaxID=66420 RepID=A0A194QNQ8_PAPXU|nr:hypothetical protein RR46_03953 [Papilio xuthus]